MALCDSIAAAPARALQAVVARRGDAFDDGFASRARRCDGGCRFPIADLEVETEAESKRAGEAAYNWTR